LIIDSVLKLLAYVYAKITDVRNALYDKGVFETHDLRARVISVGNITTGGTGKTPLVAYIAEVLAAGGEKVCILTRGYGRSNSKHRVLVSDGEKVLADATTGGDEPVELAQKLLGKAIVIADADRISAAEWALRKFGVTVFVLDDGFQHRKVTRDLDIVCIDATNPFGGGKMLPAGRLREPTENLKRADIIVMIREDRSLHFQPLRQELRWMFPNAAIIEAQKSLVSIRQLLNVNDSKSVSVEQLGDRVFAFCGLGKPVNFYIWLRQENVKIVGFQEFADHHRYSQRDLSEIEAKASELNANALLTTAKDAVKLTTLKFTMPCYVAEMKLSVDNPAGFDSLLK
jgi:tetraacyldisaccharide 4'-kinase